MSYFKDWTLFEKIWLATSLTIMICLSLIWGDNIIALLSGIAGTISVILCAKGKIENYAFGLFQAITYGYICYTANIFGEVMYNIVMVPMIIIGFFNWKKNLVSNTNDVIVRNITKKGGFTLTISTIMLIFIYSLILKSIGGDFVLIDATTTSLSLVATVLMMYRYSEQWLVWIFVNIASVILWINAFVVGDSSAMTMIIMWSAYLFNAIYGYINWRKMSAR